MIRCQSCGKELPDGSKFCDSCGSLVNEAPATNNYADNNAYTGDVSNGAATVKTGLSDNMKKYIKLGGIAVAAIVVLIIIISIIASSGEPTSNHALYFKGDELMFTGLGKIEPYEVTDESMGVKLSDDGEILVYIEDAKDNTLYWREANDADAKPVEIKDDVTSFDLTSDGKYIVFISDGGLYEYNTKKEEETKISKEADYCEFVNDDCYLYFETDTDERTKDEEKYEAYVATYFIKEFGKEEKELAKDVDELVAVTEDLKEFYYIADGNLYYVKAGKEAEKIDSDVYGIQGVYTNGDIYYTKSDETEVNPADYITDEDAKAEYEEYAEYMDEEELMETLTTYSLHYYNGKSSAEVSKTLAYASKAETAVSEDSYAYFDSITIGWREKAVSTASIADMSKIELESAYSSVYSAYSDTAKRSFVVNGVICAIDKDDATDFVYSEDGSTVYYLADISYDYSDYEEEFEAYEGDEYATLEEYCEGNYYSGEFNGATLFKATIGKDSVKKTEEIATDVYEEYSLIDTEKGKTVAYFKDWDDEDECGTLFVNDREIDTDVNGIASIFTGTDTFIYATDFKDDEFSLKLCKNGKKSVEIAHDVILAAFTDEGDVLYINDYDMEDREGSFFVFTGKKSKEIDSDVSYFVPDMSANTDFQF